MGAAPTSPARPPGKRRPTPDSAGEDPLQLRREQVARMRSLKARVKALEDQQKAATWQLWRQDVTGRDVWTCKDYPGQKYTKRQVRHLPLPDGMRRLFIARKSEPWPD